jgi:copper resistance protein B
MTYPPPPAHRQPTALPHCWCRAGAGQETDHASPSGSEADCAQSPVADDPRPSDHAHHATPSQPPVAPMEHGTQDHGSMDHGNMDHGAMKQGGGVAGSDHLRWTIPEWTPEWMDRTWTTGHGPRFHNTRQVPAGSPSHEPRAYSLVTPADRVAAPGPTST